jgi:hypothetical protein
MRRSVCEIEKDGFPIDIDGAAVVVDCATVGFDSSMENPIKIFEC